MSPFGEVEQPSSFKIEASLPVFLCLYCNGISKRGNVTQKFTYDEVDTPQSNCPNPPNRNVLTQHHPTPSTQRHPTPPSGDRVAENTTMYGCRECGDGGYDLCVSCRFRCLELGIEPSERATVDYGTHDAVQDAEDKGDY